MEKGHSMESIFLEKFGVELESVSDEIKELWRGYDIFWQYIDDYTQWKRADDYNTWIVSEIKKLLNTEE